MIRKSIFLALASSQMIALTLLSTPAMGQSIQIQDEFSKKIQAAQTTDMLSSGFLGEEVNETNGKTVFTNVDIDLPGNNSLPVKLGRRLVIDERYMPQELGGFGNWDMDVPYIEATVSKNLGWVVTNDSATKHKRCSMPGPAMTEASQISSQEAWHGNRIHVPGVADELMLAEQNNYQDPTDGQAYPWILKSMARVGCLPVLKNGYAGEGFLLKLTDGTKYYFDHVIERYAPPLSKGPKSALGYSLERKRIFIVATRIEDRHGNSVDYTYGPSGLTSIQSSDGRRIDVTHTSSAITAIANGRTWTYTLSDGYLTQVMNPDGRNWTYSPFGSKDLLSSGPGYDIITTDFFSPADQCLAQANSYGGSTTPFSVKHPSGAVGNFTFTGTTFQRAKVPYMCAIDFFDHQLTKSASLISGNWATQCRLQTNFYPGPDPSIIWEVQPPGETSSYLLICEPTYEITDFSQDEIIEVSGYARILSPNYYNAFSLTSLSISGPLNTTQTTNYDYQHDYTDYCDQYSHETGQVIGETCASISAENSWRTVTKTLPNGEIIRTRVGTAAGLNEGMVLAREIVSQAGQVVSGTSYQYAHPDPQQVYPFNKLIGISLTSDPISDFNQPLKKTTTTQSGVTYTNQVNSFDAFARPLSVTRSNSNGFSKTEQTAYADNLNKWVLGQVASVTDVATGLVEQSNSYDANTANLLSKSAFGVLQESFTYNANGTLATVKDGKNNTYTLSNWKRGIPQLISAPNGTTQSGVVNDSGWLTSITNQLGITTGYAYDAMGRLTSITPPTGDTVAWAGTTLSFTPLTASIYGVPIGGWKHTISRGNYRKETYMDALYRPLVVREYDNANVAGTERFTRKSYDTLNREVFSAYPGINAGVAVGVRTEYDALGRVTATKADSELGVLTTTTEYLTGGGIKVTGPDGQITTRTFRSLDAPSYDQMISEAAPGGVTTSISRDGFGKPLTITRSGTDGLSISKRFAYDANQRLCMRTEPETGTSIIDYDAASNVLWAANGQAVSNPAVCERTAAQASAKINYSYDALNRITNTDVPGSSNDPTVTYFADGAVNSLTNGTAKWEYTYNKLGKPVTEKLTVGTRISTITHAYDTLANESSLSYPTGLVVSYAPNALGQATQAGSYATGMTYRASGFLTGMTYGNGATYSAKPNLRGLPARRLDQRGTTVITDELMAYDANANPTCVRDSTGGSRDFTYDARDRLIKASAPNQPWVSAQYQYDSMDDIAMARLGDRQYNYGYNSKGQLSEVATPATTPTATNFGLLSCADNALLADLSGTVVDPGTGGGTGGGTGAVSITPTTLPNGLSGTPYSQALSSSGGTAPYTYTLSAGTLPAGLSLSATGISGTPSLAVTKTFSITSTDSAGNTGTRSYTLTIGGSGSTGGSLVLSPSTLDYGMVNEPYSQTLSTTGGTAPYTYSRTSGNLPLGLSLIGNTISGTPSNESSLTFTITSTDSIGATGSKVYSLEILPNGGGGGGGNQPLIVDDGKSNNGKHLGQLKQEGEINAALAAGDTLKYLFTHDANGRMTAKGTQDYVYDALNRMTQVTSKESYLYDGHGRRVQITKTSDGKQNFPIYSLDGKLLMEDNRQTSKRTEYIYAGGRLVAKRIQPLKADGTNDNNKPVVTTTIHTDFLGSPVAETSSTGAVIKVERFTPYGEAADLTLDAGPGFTGHATDVATGLTYMQQRYYDAELGRFISPDPVGPEEDFIKHFNRYNYALNNPVRYTDPDGRKVTCSATTCIVNPVGSDLPSLSFPKPDGFSESISRADSVFHHGYRFDVFAGTGDANYSSRLDQGLINSPTPILNKPASANGALIDANASNEIHRFTGKDNVLSYYYKLKNGDTAVLNVTLNGHAGSSGIVLRVRTTDKNGNNIIVNYGEGDSVAQRLLDRKNQTSREVWERNSRQIIDEARSKP